MGFDLDVVVIGGGGHVGLPLSMLFARPACRPRSSIPIRAGSIRSVLA